VALELVQGPLDVAAEGLHDVAPNGVRHMAQPPAPRSVSPRIAEFVRQALADRFTAGDIPDLGLVEDRTHVFVRREMFGDGLLLGPDALPAMPGVKFELVALKEAEARAAHSGRNVVFISVDRPQVSGDTASIWLGVDIAVPPRSGVIKMCCCTSLAEFRRADDRWAFVKYSRTTCS